MIPSGKLIIIGGAIDTGSFTEKEFGKENNMNFFEHGILKRIITETGKKNPRVEFLTTASQIPDQVGKEYVRAFEILGVKNTGVMNITSREMADKDEILRRLSVCDALMMTGGDQLRLTSILGGTRFSEIMTDKYFHEEFVIAGTSAGAAACSNMMIYQGSSSEALLKGEIKITGGLGLINDVVIDTHFVQRGRIGRLFQAVVSNPRILGIGLGEDTGLLIKHNNEMEAIGSGLVILVDGKRIRDTNITDVEMGAPISINHLIVHVMSLHDTYNVKEGLLVINKTEPKIIADKYVKLDR